MIKLHSSLSSAYKNVYLLVFAIAAAAIAYQLLRCKNALWEVVQGGGTGSINYYTFVGALVVFCIAIFFHLMRIYVSMEQLEDPTTEEHRLYIKPLRGWRTGVEQAVRILIIVIVSLKFVPVFNTIHRLAYYLVILYSSLLLWDVFIHFAGKLVWRDTFIGSSIVGLIVSITLTWMTIPEHSFSQDARVIDQQANAFRANVTERINLGEYSRRHSPQLDQAVSNLLTAATQLTADTSTLTSGADSLVEQSRPLSDRSYLVIVDMILLIILALYELFVRPKRFMWAQYLRRMLRECFRPYYGQDCGYSDCEKF